jgi:hypothetical protein
VVGYTIGGFVIVALRAFRLDIIAQFNDLPKNFNIRCCPAKNDTHNADGRGKRVLAFIKDQKDANSRCGYP